MKLLQRHQHRERTRSQGLNWKAIAALFIVSSAAFLAGAQWEWQQNEQARQEGRDEAERACPGAERLLLTGADPERPTTVALGGRPSV